MSATRDDKLYAQLVNQHNRGKIAIHMTPNADSIQERLDDPRILNNLREDGGTELRDKKDYQLYLNISATLLPPSKQIISQRLYERRAHCFCCLDVDQTRIKNFSMGDAWTDYKPNKHGRPSYKYGYSIYEEKISKLNMKERADFVEKMNDNISRLALFPRSGGRLFGERSPSNIRPMNEIVLKIRNESMVAIGALAIEVEQHPYIIFELIQFQNRLKKIPALLIPFVCIIIIKKR